MTTILCMCATLWLGQLEELPLSVTSYWPFDENGHAVAYGGQADGNPHVYANMMPTSPDHAHQVAACISDWTTLGHTTAVTFWWLGEEITVACWDAFGAEAYRRPFFHDGYGRTVIPIDILSPTPYHGLVHDWSTLMVPVADPDG